MADNNEKEVRYLNKDFDSLKDKLENFLRVYYPDTYNDFSESSLGSVYVDLAAYVGDVLSYYTDSQFKESLIQHAEERENIHDLANSLGYRPQNSKPAVTTLDVFIVLPAKQLNAADDKNVFGESYQVGDIVPDLKFAPIIEEGMVVSSDTNSSVKFRTTREIDFGEDNFDNPVEVRIFEEDNQGNPTSFLLRKKVQAVAGSITTERFDFSDPIQFNQIELSRDNVLEILNVRDSDDNKWHEVSYLAQDTVFEEFRNTKQVDPNLAEDEDIRFVLDTIRTPRRFTKRSRSDGTTLLQFGSGVSKNPNQRIIPDAKNIGDPTADPIDRLDQPIDPSNFLFSDSYGQVPFDTTIEVTYTFGGGIQSNVPNNDLINVDSASFDIDNVAGLDAQTIQSVQNSLGVVNKEPATGGASGDTVEEIRQNAMAFFSAQDRAVTRKDYRVRALSMPARYGSVAKVFVSPDHLRKEEDFKKNPLGIDLHVLGYDNNQNLVKVSDTVKHNLKTYLSQFRMLTDGVNLKDGYIINIQVEFDIVVFNSFNRRDVLTRAIDEVKDMFSIKKRSFNQPIIRGEIINQINDVEGVQNVADLKIRNVFNEDEGYSGNIYDIRSATKDGIIYPSLDPSVFELRYPNRDVKARAV